MGSTSCLKKFALAIEILCMLIALVLIAFGIYVLCAYDPNEIGQTAAYAYIGVGVATIVILLFGCIGTLRENVCCTVTFVILSFIIIIAQVAAVFLLSREDTSIASNLTNSLDATWEDELNNPGAMSHYETWFNCCGRASPQDYIVNSLLPPATCYKNGDSNSASNLILKGCRIEFENYWIHLLLIFNILAWILIGFELFVAILSCVFCNSIRNDRRRSYF